MSDDNDMIDFNVKLEELTSPPAIETENVYHNDDKNKQCDTSHYMVKLFQTIGIENTNYCIIKEVGCCDESSKANIITHTSIIKNNKINILTKIYDSNELSDLDKFQIVCLQILSNDIIIGDYQFCFCPKNKITKNDFSYYKKDHILLQGQFCIYDNMAEKIIKNYSKFIGNDFVVKELIESIG